MASSEDSEERLKAALADRYRIEHEIGSGGMATVYLAEDLKHERGVAVKVLRPEAASSLGTDRFLAEIRLTARLQHPHIVPLFDSGEASGFLYYVMPYIEGESLRACLESEGRLDVEGMLAIARPVAQALTAAHDLGVVHRDIKPENILLSRGQPFVTDFGIARAVSVAGGERLTATGVSVGTPAYMSPEQVLGEESVDERSDVYSLGCVIYEMLSGKAPFSGATVQALLARRLTGPPPHLTNVPSPVDEVVRRSLATAPQDRFATALALADALVEAARRPASDELSIVVLPFENLSPDPDQEFFADGLTDEIIADLSLVGPLRVISRTSAMQLKGTKKDLATIGQELNVRYVLEGSVRRAGNSLRITAQLVDAPTDTHLWAGKYPGTLEDVFDIQEKVSRAIVGALKIALNPAEERRLKERPIDNIRAYEWFLKARGEIMEFAPDALHRAHQYLEAAIEITGPNPYLYAGMAFAHLQRANLGVAQEEAIALADDYVSKALELDPNSPLALTVSGTTEYWFRGNPQEAVFLLKRALAVDPNETMALTSLAMAYVNYAGKTAAGRPLVERLRALDPLDGGMLWLVGAIPFFEGNFQKALVEWRRIHKMVPDGPIERLYHGLAVSYTGDVEGAFDVLGGAEPPKGEDLPSRLCRVLTFALVEDKEGALGELTPEARQTVIRDGAWAHLFAAPLAFVGAVDEAIELLEQGVRRGGFLNYPMLAEHDPFLRKLRGDPRYEALVEEARQAWEIFEV